jgi:hypothetical protein
MRVLEVDAHEVGHWGVSRLDTVIALLNNLGMVWQSSYSYSNEMYTEAYEASTIKLWSNTVCADQNKPRLLHLLDISSTCSRRSLKGPGEPN